MPTFTGKTFSSFYKNLLGMNQTSNTGVDNTTRTIQDGLGQDTSLSLSKQALKVKPGAINSTEAMHVQNIVGDNILAVDTTNSIVKVGASQVPANTLFKEMGLYSFSPSNAGYHYPLIANMVGMRGDEQLTSDNDWGSGTDPATSLDLSGLTDSENAVAVYWYIENDITLDAVRYMIFTEGTGSDINFHLFSYDLDVSSNPGDLSNGEVCASASESAATYGNIRTGTFSLDDADIVAGKIVIGFVEDTVTADDLTVHFNIKYHIR